MNNLDWIGAPWWANYAAMDPDGSWYYYSDLPEYDGEVWVARTGNYEEFYPETRFLFEARDTLEVSPKMARSLEQLMDSLDPEIVENAMKTAEKIKARMEDPEREEDTPDNWDADDISTDMEQKINDEIQMHRNFKAALEDAEEQEFIRSLLDDDDDDDKEQIELNSNLLRAAQNYSRRVENPAHYTAGRQYEVIDVIEENVFRAKDAELGFLQGQVLKYLMRMWDKNAPLEDAQKAEWYLKRMISKMEDS